MYTTVNEHDFIESFDRMGRLITNVNPTGNFTVNGLRALFEYLEDIEAGTDEPIELDVIGLCCEFSEYPSAWEAFQEYTHPDEVEAIQDTYIEPDEIEEYARDYFRDNTTLIEFDEGVIIGEF